MKNKRSMINIMTLVMVFASILIIPIYKASAKVTAIIVNVSAGSYREYGYDNLIVSLLEKKAIGSSKLYDEFATGKVVAYIDDVKGNVDIEYLKNQLMDAKASGNTFNLTSTIESANADDIIDITGTISERVIDSNGDVADKDNSKAEASIVSLDTLNGTTVITAALPDGIDGSKYDVTVTANDGNTVKLTYDNAAKQFVGSLNGTYTKTDLTIDTSTKSSDTEDFDVSDIY